MGDNITAAHEPHFNADEMQEVRQEIRQCANATGIRAVALQLVDDLEAAYLRLDVAYGRLDAEVGGPSTRPDNDDDHD